MSMCDTPIRHDAAEIRCSMATKNVVRAYKRAGQTYDELLWSMVDQYDPSVTSYYGEANDGV